jgi:hypothetical protein
MKIYNITILVLFSLILSTISLSIRKQEHEEAAPPKEYDAAVSQHEKEQEVK